VGKRRRGGDKGKGIDRRGNNEDRRRRRRWLLKTFCCPDLCWGFSRHSHCHWCDKILTLKTLEVDRYPIAGKDGGTYRRGNIVPACWKCNGGRG